MVRDGCGVNGGAVVSSGVALDEVVLFELVDEGEDAH